MKRVFIVANPGKPNVAAALETLVPWLQQRADVVGVEADGDRGRSLAPVDADFILVLGGDGTLLSAARRLGGREIPLMGVNFGRLGFLASFTPDQFEAHFDMLIAGRLPIQSRLMIEASVVPQDAQCRLTDRAQVAEHRSFVATALNDAVITAGPPFHMVELEIGADGES